MLRIIKGRKTRDIYYYDSERKHITDKEGNILKVYEDISNISDENLSIIIDDFFHDYYKLANEFKNTCVFLNKSEETV